MLRVQLLLLLLLRFVLFVLFLFDLAFHFTAALLHQHELLVLLLHGLLVLALFELQLAQVLLGHPQLLIQLGDLHVVLALAIQLL